MIDIPCRDICTSIISYKCNRKSEWTEQFCRKNSRFDAETLHWRKFTKIQTLRRIAESSTGIIRTPFLYKNIHSMQLNFQIPPRVSSPMICTKNKGLGTILRKVLFLIAIIPPPREFKFVWSLNRSQVTNTLSEHSMKLSYF